MLLVSVVPGEAQDVFRLQAGSSSLYQSHGASLQFWGSGYDGWLGLGYMGDPRFGGFLRTQVKGRTLELGDTEIPFRLPTDVLGGSPLFQARGAGVRGQNGWNYFAFTGATSRGFVAPYFRGSEMEVPVALLFSDRQLTRTLHFYTRNALSTRQTSIHAVRWRPEPGLDMALAGGIGANQRYLATSLKVERRWLSLQSAYVHAGDRFRRVMTRTPLGTEVDRENVVLTLRPTSTLSLSAGHQSFQPTSTGVEAASTRIDHGAAYLGTEARRLSVSLFSSPLSAGTSRGTSVGIGARLGRRIEADASVLHSQPAEGDASTSLLGVLRGTISPRLGLLTMVTHSGGQSSVSFGGSYLSNEVAASAEYRTLFVPSAVGEQFKQVLVLNVRAQPLGNIQLNTGTQIAPDGTVRYTISASTFLYGRGRGRGRTERATFHEYVVWGRVIVEAGDPLRGAALQIGEEIVYTNSQGEFLVRLRRAGTYALQVLPGEFLSPGRFEVVSAPLEVRAEPEGRATSQEIVLRRR